MCAIKKRRELGIPALMLTSYFSQSHLSPVSQITRIMWMTKDKVSIFIHRCDRKNKAQLLFINFHYFWKWKITSTTTFCEVGKEKKRRKRKKVKKWPASSYYLGPWDFSLTESFSQRKPVRCLHFSTFETAEANKTFTASAVHSVWSSLQDKHMRPRLRTYLSSFIPRNEGQSSGF